MIFSELNEKELALLEPLGTLRSYASNETVIQEGHPGRSFFLIVSGQVEVRKSLRRAKYKKLSDLGPFDVFGEVCFLGVETRSASVVCLTDAKIYEFDRDKFVAYLDRKPDIGVKIYRGMARELARRLAKASEDLRDAIIWSLGTKYDREANPEMDIPARPKLKIQFGSNAPPPPPDPSGRAV
ncbi:MAG TPA: cyclic nucleotide-binding domain-containing protein [Kiritimatiellia bacterium]|jgi:CRP-like cAMP-binding protein